MSKEKLCEVISTLADKSQYIINNEFPTDNFPGKFSREFYLQENELISMRRSLQPDYDSCLYLTRDKVEALPEYSVAINLLKSDPYFGMNLDALAGSGSIFYRVQSDRVLCHLLSSVLEIADKSRWEYTIKKLYDEMSQWSIDGHVVHEYVSYIDGLAIESGRLELQGNVILEQLDQAEQIKLLNNDPYFRRLYATDDYYRFFSGGDLVRVSCTYASPWQVCGEKEEPVHRQEFPEADEALNRMEKCLAALHLCFDSGVRHSEIIHVLHHPPIKGFPGKVSSVPQQLAASSNSLTVQREKDLKEIWSTVRMSSDIPNINKRVAEIALRRLYLIGSRVMLEDRLIDAFIGFEAILGSLMRRNVEGELGFRLSLLVANMLGTKDPERVRFYDVMKKGYTLRSKIVHGSLLSIDDKTILNDCILIFRRFLRKWLSMTRCGKSSIDVRSVYLGIKAKSETV